MKALLIPLLLCACLAVVGLAAPDRDGRLGTVTVGPPPTPSEDWTLIGDYQLAGEGGPVRLRLYYGDSDVMLANLARREQRPADTVYPNAFDLLAVYSADHRAWRCKVFYQTTRVNFERSVGSGPDEVRIVLRHHPPGTREVSEDVSEPVVEDLEVPLAPAPGPALPDPDLEELVIAVRGGKPVVQGPLTRGTIPVEGCGSKEA